MASKLSLTAQLGRRVVRTPSEQDIVDKYEKRVKIMDLKEMLHQPSDMAKMIVTKQIEKYVPFGLKALGSVPRYIVRMALVGASALFLFLLKTNSTIRKWSMTLAKAFVLISTTFALMISGLLYGAQSYYLKQKQKQAKKKLELAEQN
uniref:Uncharacterized protein n=1 Tax=Strombidium inclinatum TaxID=197538 RepID=A0A7S3IPM8_9SPIT|mmetsp:Transcript_32442/g.49637  ORF Transcript_32442/g.49637 Transcript_32442/m.49637 type:complete len:148 (+) Transcript_32442:1278-1721(+)